MIVRFRRPGTTAGGTFYAADGCQAVERIAPIAAMVPDARWSIDPPRSPQSVDKVVDERGEEDPM